MSTALNFLLVLCDCAAPGAVDEATWRRRLVEGAIAAEVLDAREAGLIFRMEASGSDFDLIKERWQQLADAPPVSDALRFPSRTVVLEYLDLNRKYRNYLERLQWTESVGAALEETERLHKLWELVWFASTDTSYVCTRREALQALRQQLGDEAYYAARLPTPVPLHRFQQVP